MKITLICSVHNEENNLQQLFDSILKQTKEPDRIIFIEDSSTDKTINSLRKFQEKCGNVKIFQVKNRNISKNRNFAIEKSENGILVCVDAGCELNKNYIEKISKPFEDKKIYFVGGISKILPKNLFDKCFASFIVKEKISKGYLPKGHAMAFKKSLWEKIGGFPEQLALGAEDTYFGKKAIEFGFRPFIVKEAIVYWETRSNLKTIFKQFKSYGYWDGKAFSFNSLPKNSKLSILISIFFPLTILHAVYKGLKLFLKFKTLKALWYGIGIDIFKIYGYLFGLIRGKVK